MHQPAHNTKVWQKRKTKHSIVCDVIINTSIILKAKFLKKKIKATVDQYIIWNLRPIPMQISNVFMHFLVTIILLQCAGCSGFYYVTDWVT